MNTQTANESAQVSSESYQQLVERVDRLEKLLLKLVEIAENRGDVRAMREAEIAYRSGDAIAFGDLVDELLAEE